MAFLLATILAFGWRLRRWRGAPIWQVCALCLLAVATTLAYAATPYSASNPSHDYRLTPWMQQAIRYAFPLVGLVGVLGAVAIDCARESRPILVATGMTLAIVEVWGRGAPGTVAAAMTVWAAWMAGGLVDRSSWRLAGRTMVVAAALLAVGITTSRAWGKRRADRLKQYGGVQDFIAQTIGTEELVGYPFSSRPYVLYGVTLRQQVANVTPSAGGSLDDWLEELRREGISLLAVGPLPRRHRMRPEVQWTLRADGPFERVHGERPAREVVLYRLRRP
jgi:hypothetical protein